MIFYKIAVMPKENEISDDREVKERLSRVFKSRTRKMTQTNQAKIMICVTDLDTACVMMAAISDAEYTLSHSIKELAKEFLDECGIKAEKIAEEEISFEHLNALLDSADRSDFIFSRAQIYAAFRIGGDLRRGFRCLDEYIIEKEISKSDLKKVAYKSMCDEELYPEIERICAKSPEGRTVIQHPVHYLFRFDENEIVSSLMQAFISFLLQNNRLASRRYVDFQLSPYTDERDIEGLRSMYGTMAGGAVILEFFKERGEDGEFTDPSAEMAERACRIAAEYKKKVLTIFCFSKADERAKTTICGYLDDIPLVEISTASVNYKNAKIHLAAMAKENQMAPDKALYDKLSDRNALYNSNDLKKAFTSWYHFTLKTKIYPQYAAISASRAISVKAPPKGSAYEELEHMIGLTEAKRVITNALNYFKIQKLCSSHGVVNERPAMHMVFTGNPGTAKTTAARLFSRIMKENNLLSVGELVEVGRADLVGAYVGWTAKIVKEKFKAAKGSVLFIDEAYSLVDGRSGLFGDEAINTIVQEMENHRDDMVVIFAGYPDKMSEFLDRNPGLRSRIAFHVPFPDYSPQELSSILELMCQKQKIKIFEDAKEKLYRIFESAEKQQDFGNGRFVRNLLESAKLRQASRLVKTDCDKITDDDLFTLEAEDFEYTPQAPRIYLPQKTIPGFCG